MADVLRISRDENKMIRHAGKTLRRPGGQPRCRAGVPTCDDPKAGQPLYLIGISFLKKTYDLFGPASEMELIRTRGCLLSIYKEPPGHFYKSNFIAATAALIS